MNKHARQRRAAVIGSGVSGLTAAYLLRNRYQVTLYEADGRLGGHAHTHEVATHDDRLLGLDTGFLVHNTRNYPSLIRLFGELGVQTQPAEMSMSVRCQGCGLEYAGSRGLRGLVPAAGALTRPGYLAMLATVPSFYRAARRLVDSGAPDSLTLGEFLAAGRYGPYFTGHFVVPLVAAVWSCSPASALSYPARYLFEFLDNHGILSVGRTPTWRTVTGGSKTYVDKIAKELTAVRPGTPVRALRRSGEGVEIVTDDGQAAHFEVAVVAAHPDQALQLLAEPTKAEREVLGAFRYTRSVTVLHTDENVLPARRSLRSSWNYLLTDCAATADQVHVSYYLNRLQRLAEPVSYLVTLNKTGQVAPGRVLGTMTYSHPLYTPESVAAQRRLPELNSPMLAYAGAYHGWGFHEDGCRSGVAAAAALGVDW